MASSGGCEGRLQLNNLANVLRHPIETQMLRFMLRVIPCVDHVTQAPKRRIIKFGVGGCRSTAVLDEQEIQDRSVRTGGQGSTPSFGL